MICAPFGVFKAIVTSCSTASERGQEGGTNFISRESFFEIYGNRFLSVRLKFIRRCSEIPIIQPSEIVPFWKVSRKVDKTSQPFYEPFKGHFEVSCQPSAVFINF